MMDAQKVHHDNLTGSLTEIIIRVISIAFGCLTTMLIFTGIGAACCRRSQNGAVQAPGLIPMQELPMRIEFPPKAYVPNV